MVKSLGQYCNKTIKKGDLLKAEKPNAMYVLSANKIGPVLTEILGKKPLKWTSLEEAIKLRECIEKKNKEAFFVAKGHTGMIKKDYTDPHFPYKDKGEIWITE